MTEAREEQVTSSDRPEGTLMLACDDVFYSYGAIEALHGVSVRVNKGEAICVVGANGAGKTTLARILGGLAKPRSGSVRSSTGPTPPNPKDVVTSGIASVLEGRHLFTLQDVRTNLELGAYATDGSRRHRNLRAERIDRIFELFPALVSRQRQLAGSLSGGEQQMVAIGRALMSEPEVLILDEPSTGLSPKLSGEVFAALEQLRSRGLSLVLVEQNAVLAFQLTSYVYLLQQGTLVEEGTVEAMRATDLIRQIYLGGHVASEIPR